MTQPPQGSPPGSGYPPTPPDEGGYRPPAEEVQPAAPEGGYPPPNAGYPTPEGGYLPPDAAPYPPVEAYPVEPQVPPGYVAGLPSEPPQEPRRRSPMVAPILAFVALVLVGGASLFLVNYLNATIDDAATEASLEPGPVAAADPATEPEPTVAPEPTDEPPTGTEPTEAPAETLEPEPEETAEPITVVPPSDQRADVAGSLLFTRLGGDIWSASGTTMRSLTNSSSTKADSNPTWSPDGKRVYFIRSTKREVRDGRARLDGKYTLYPTDLMSMKADGSDRKRVFNSLIKDSRGEWFSHVLQPSVSSAGNNVAVVSDGNDGAGDGVELHIINAKSGRMRKVSAPTEALPTMRLGHNDPDFSPDGKHIAFTYNDNASTEGDPRVGVFTCQTKSKCTSGRTKLLKSGYANPSWSPSGALLAVEATDGTGRDIAIISAKGGHERVQLTNDGNSFAPEFSPNGDQIAYLKRDGLGIDLRIMSLEIDDKGKITLVDDRPVTSDGEVDGDSGLSWYIPRSERSRSVDAAEAAGEEESLEEDLLEGAPPPPPTS